MTTRSSPLIGDYRIVDSSGAVGKDNARQSQWPVAFKPPRPCWVILHFRLLGIGTEDLAWPIHLFGLTGAR